MDPNRARLEASLTALLNRALLIVPYVRLDSVAAVTALFQSALDYMQTNIIVDEDDAETIQVDTPRADGDVSDLPEFPVTLASKLSSALVTRDYSSPSQSKRSLSQSPAPQPVPIPTQTQSAPAQTAPTRDNTKRAPLHIGAVPATAASGSTGNAAAAKIGIGIGGLKGGSSSGGGNKAPSTLSMAPSHKPSSRAVISQSALRMHSDGADDISADSADDVSDDSGNTNTERAGAVKPYNKLLSRAGTDFSSPKLGPRSLAASPSTMGPRGVSAPLSMTSEATSHTASDTDTTTAETADTPDINLPMLTEPLELGKDQAHQLFSTPRRSNGANDNANNDDDGAALEKDLVDTALERLQSPNNHSQIARRESLLTQLPVVASPKQIRSSLHLLSLAAKEADTTKTNNNAVDNAVAATTLSDASLSATPTLLDPIESFGVGSPKPGFLRRLDSPQSHHGQLIQAKLSLSALMNKILQTIPQTKTAALSGAHTKLTAAIRKLEQSVTVQTP